MINASPSNSRSLCNAPRFYVVLAAFIVVGALLALPLFTGSASAPTKSTNRSAVQYQLENSTVPSQPNIAIPNFFLQGPPAPPSPVTLETFAGDCTTPKTLYNLQDTDLVVCAKFTHAAPGWQVIWSNAHFVAVQSATVTAATGSATFTLNPNSSLGDWRVILYEPFGGTVQQATRFTVIDAENPKADVTVSTGLVSSGASSGHQVLFSVQVSNLGPDDAPVTLTDDVPANTTFESFGQLAGPTFNCTNPNTGETGTTTCTIASLGTRGVSHVLSHLSCRYCCNGTVITNTASAATTTTDPDADNNTSTTEVTVANAPC